MLYYTPLPPPAGACGRTSCTFTCTPCEADICCAFQPVLGACVSRVQESSAALMMGALTCSDVGFAAALLKAGVCVSNAEQVRLAGTVHVERNCWGVGGGVGEGFGVCPCRV